jgi:glycosyltransferase involved in cell wall biosynthesis
LDIHDPVPELFLCKFPRLPGARIAAAVLRYEERTAARMADAVLCVHDVHREVTENHAVPAAKLRVVLNAADGKLFPIRSPQVAAPFLVYHGTLTERMGLDVVLKSFKILRHGLDWRAAFWGDGDVVDDLRRLRDQLGLEGLVEIPGKRVILEELVPRLGTVGISLAPMRRDVFTDILLPTKLLEVVRLGIPSVVTWTPTVARYFPEDSVYYVRDFTPEGLASVLSRALDQPEEAREKAAKAQSLPIALSWQDIEQDFVGIVEDVATRKDRKVGLG